MDIQINVDFWLTIALMPGLEGYDNGRQINPVYNMIWQGGKYKWKREL